MTFSESGRSRSLCIICSQRSAVYTCPRCAIRTCSLPCSKSHKTLRSCSGVRDRTEYVPMNKYGWGTMGDDYTYLEEVGRKTAEWGLDIVKGGFLANMATAGGRGNGRGRGRGARNAPRGNKRGKRDVLKLQLDARDIDVEMLPQGMERRKLNQSTWDVRSKSLSLTVEFVFHFPKNTLAPNAPEFTLLTHRNKLNSTLTEILQQSVHGLEGKDVIPSWVKSLLPSSEGDESNQHQLVYLMAQHADTPLNPVAKTFHKLDASRSLLIALRNKTFVEYPKIDIWEDGDFTGTLVETDGTFVEGDEHRPAKRRRLDVAAGHKVLDGLLGGYISQEEDRAEENNILGMLGSYGSDEDSALADGVDASARGNSEEEPEGEGEEEEGDAKVPTMEEVREIFDAVGNSSIPEEHLHWSEGDDGDEWEESTDGERELEYVLEQQRIFRGAG